MPLNYVVWVRWELILFKSNRQISECIFTQMWPFDSAHHKRGSQGWKQMGLGLIAQTFRVDGDSSERRNVIGSQYHFEIFCNRYLRWTYNRSGKWCISRIKTDDPAIQFSLRNFHVLWWKNINLLVVSFFLRLCLASRYVPKHISEYYCDISVCIAFPPAFHVFIFLLEILKWRVLFRTLDDFYVLATVCWRDF